MTYKVHPGETVPESGIYRVAHNVRHISAAHEVTVIKGRRFPTCRQCKGIGFGPVHLAKHAWGIPHLRQKGATALA